MATIPSAFVLSTSISISRTVTFVLEANMAVRRVIRETPVPPVA